MITDDKPAIALPDGMSLKPRIPMAPPKGRNPFFGWLDHGGDENTYRFDDILGAVRSRGDGRYYLYVRQLTQPVAIPEKDYFRLLRQMGWTEESPITRAN